MTTYDPAGNITRIQDAALKTIFHDGQQVEPICEYTYDALYRLIESRGREHIGQTAHDFDPLDGNRRDSPFVGLRAYPNDMQTIRNYTERYEYDPVGNFQFMRHSANGGSWTRRYEYEEDSLLEPGKQSNRLTRTMLGNGLNHTEVYTYTDAQGQDIHGCMTAINSMTMVWNFEDQLQGVALGGGGTAYYVYDAGGQRVRKVIETQNGIRQSERIYIGGYEVYREYNGNGRTVLLERESLHIMDDKQRIALVETRTQGNDPAPAQLIRYQLGNHLGSASLELDHLAQSISYEEYSPYGSTSYQAARGQAETPKRYRYTGKERDEENGLYYHGARYYAAWLGRWISVDPIFEEQLHWTPYRYCFDNPVNRTDKDGQREYPEDYKGKLSKYDWKASDRNEYTDKWSAAMESITKDRKQGELAVPSDPAPFDKVRDYYLWALERMRDKGHEVRWFLGATALVSDLAEAFSDKPGPDFRGGRFPGLGATAQTQEFLAKVNVGIANYAVEKVYDLLFGEYASAPLKGQAAMTFDHQFVKHEQEEVAMPIYKIASKEVLKEVNQMARREGISKYGQSVYIPSFATYGFDLTRDDFAKGGRVEMPMLMLWPESFKPQSKGFEKHLDVAGLLQEEALQDFKRSHRSLKKEVQKRKLLRNYTVFKRRSRGG